MSEVNVADAGLDVDTEAPPPKKGRRLVKGVILVAAVIAIEVVVNPAGTQGTRYLSAAYQSIMSGQPVHLPLKQKVNPLFESYNPVSI